AQRIHAFEQELTDGEAGAFVGLILSDGHFTDRNIQVYQKNHPVLLDLWVGLAEKLGFEPRMREENGTMEAAIDSAPLVEYLDARYSLRNPEELLNAPEAFRKQFLQTFLLAESHFDPEQKRVTFTQKDEETVNIIAHMLQQFGIRPWIKDRGRVFRIKIQGKDLQKYLETFAWPGGAPDVDRFEGTHRTVPVDVERMQRIVDLLGLKYDALSERDWYQSFRMHRQRDQGAITERSLQSFIEDVEQEIERRRGIDAEDAAQEDLQGTAQRCGVAITDIVDGTGLTKHAVWSAYDGGEVNTEAVQYVSEVYEERIEEAERLLMGLKQLVDNDVFYDPITQIDSESYEGSVIGLSVPRTHNYLAGRGACGINHNTYPLPEAQMDRFMMKIFV
ncbi:MAG: LAGLIDADG family homing endonuclease, partial [Candidatus Nanohaloarchaea archaeon]|nr:LAGLIDADG family homing endonuclease [Candidatus Nanohaloarchaea archaeon]